MDKLSKETLQRASDGDLSAFREVYDRTSGYVYSIAYRMMHSKEDAEEITQDVFLKAHQHLKDFRFEASFETWLYRVTVNLSINLCKKRANERQKMEHFVFENCEEQTARETQRDAVDQEHMEKRLHHLLKHLNPDQRICLILRHLQEMDYKQIAETLKINMNTVRSRLKRAREKLMSLTQKEGEVL